ncbi:hypothetical protein NQ318_018551 [Aromia moschata]|uniref:HAT C-terminal dimerisation domain-containing protein n=1 Tax=Aromia moschata TaxID=1265417 RepID=A0AAV8ZHN6_9CUCU|nr:hypothetical protein NQ318_018551 [Aromia moschata]
MKQQIVRNSLLTNPDFITFTQIYDGVSTVPFSECRDLFNYACITSVDVERSFSKYKHVFSSRRTLLLDTTVETYLMYDADLPALLIIYNKKERNA